MIQFESFNAFLEMGGHGFYVWSVYLIAWFLMVWMVVRPLHRKRVLLLQIERQKKREQSAMSAHQEV